MGGAFQNNPYLVWSGLDFTWFNDPMDFSLKGVVITSSLVAKNNDVVLAFLCFVYQVVRISYCVSCCVFIGSFLL